MLCDPNLIAARFVYTPRKADVRLSDSRCGWVCCLLLSANPCLSYPGRLPTWHSCLVQHDKSYHMGGKLIDSPAVQTGPKDSTDLFYFSHPAYLDAF
jgi:hypothetical protein